MVRARCTLVALAVLGAACGNSGDLTSRSAASTAASSARTYAPCASRENESSGDQAATSVDSGSERTLQLTLTDIAKLDGAPTSAATRCTERALYVTLQAGTVVRVELDGRPDEAASTVLDIADRVTAGGEQGLLGLAFSPKGDQLYVAYTNTDQDQELDRFTVTTSGVDSSTRTRVLTIPDFAFNHNGGQLLFRPDGYLYWGMGDGGGANDTTKNTGQDPGDLLGDILRLDVLHPAGNKPYGIPPDNPFVNGGGAPEVYAYGLRNPWKFSFDPATGDLWIGDVGQGKYEEIDRVGPDEAPGANFGWSSMEGTDLLNGATSPVGIQPVHEYDHSNGACAVIGGFVYRGKAIPALDGVYLYGDNCVSQLEGLRLDGSGSAHPVDIGLGVGGLSSFGRDVDGELYALSLDGTVVRIDGA
ncbi:MAG: PQQ-dependent sugar dehydrogenase [Acidimicrobiales bacterium]